MSEAKFTSGRWWVSDSKVVMCETGRVAYAYSGHSIPYVQDIKANANLIAAAPDMYEEIERDIKWLEQMKAKFVLGSYEYRSICLRIESKQELLAKARGESNE